MKQKTEAMQSFSIYCIASVFVFLSASFKIYFQLTLRFAFKLVITADCIYSN